MVLPEAIFDVLFIGSKIEKKMSDFSISEIHFFSYTSCLLSIYEGNTSYDWKLIFIKNDNGGPYSKEINDAAEFVVGRNLISQKEQGYYTLTSDGYNILNKYSTLLNLQNRIRFLDTACKSISLVPYGYIKDAINNEPVLSSAMTSTTKRTLLDEETPATQVLHNQFRLLFQAVGEHKSLLVPAITWLESLNSKVMKND